MCVCVNVYVRFWYAAKMLTHLLRIIFRSIICIRKCFCSSSKRKLNKRGMSLTKQKCQSTAQKRNVRLGSPHFWREQQHQTSHHQFLVERGLLFWLECLRPHRKSWSRLQVITMRNQKYHFETTKLFYRLHLLIYSNFASYLRRKILATASINQIIRGPPTPRGVTRPNPVTTTRLRVAACDIQRLEVDWWPKCAEENK